MCIVIDSIYYWPIPDQVVFNFLNFWCLHTAYGMTMLEQGIILK